MPKKIPMRMCVGCREMKPKKELLRVVRSPEGEVSIDPGGKKSGRGAYVCVSEECLAAARKRDALAKALKTKVEDAVYEEILAVLREKKKERAETP